MNKTNTNEKDLKNKNVIINNNNDKSKMLVKDKIDWDKTEISKPFLKWVGGKNQIIKEILGEFPVGMNNYIEPFVGGGSVLLGLLSLKKYGVIDIKQKIYAYDLNKPLVYVYKNIQATPKKFLNTIIKIINEFYAIDGDEINHDEINHDEINRKPVNLQEAKTSQESYYYWIRSKYNQMTESEQCGLLGSAYFLFLNKTCFRGVFRMGPNGFNVPYGHYNNPGIIDKTHIKEISQLIKDVEFIHMSFEDSLKNVKKGDFVYLDPVYFKLDKNSFVDYTTDGFNQSTHDKLFKILHELKKEQINWTMSNSSAEYVLKCFDDKKKYSVKKILCRRAINSKNPESKVNEVIIKSY
jgi:DNA adenine methylase